MFFGSVVVLHRVTNLQTLVWDLSLFVILQIFPRLFLYMPKTMICSHLIIKQPASTLKFQYLYFILQINFCEWKREEHPFSAGTSCARAGPWPVVTHMLRTSQSFQTFWETCWQPCAYLTEILLGSQNVRYYYISLYYITKIKDKFNLLFTIHVVHIHKTFNMIHKQFNVRLFESLSHSWYRWWLAATMVGNAYVPYRLIIGS